MHSLRHTSDPAFGLLLRCLQVQSGGDLTDVVRPAAPSDWDRFVDLGRKHAIRPLLHRALSSSRWEGVPIKTQSYLQSYVLTNTVRNTAVASELLQLLQKLEAAGIQAATFKGPVLAECVYGSISLREFLDIDVIVRKRDFARAEDVLLDSGFETLSRKEQQHEYLAQSGQGTYRRPGARLAVDLHWKLAPLRMSFPFDEDELWSRLQPLPLAGSQVPSLAWDHLALFMAFHGAKERWRSLKWICDFSELVRARPELDWEALLRRARASHSSRCLLVAGRLSFDLGLACPPQLNAASEATIETLASETLNAVIRPAPETDLSIFFYTFRMTERRRDKLLLVATLLTTLTVSDFRTVRLPVPLRGLYYAIRPFRIAVKAIALLLRGRRPVA